MIGLLFKKMIVSGWFPFIVLGLCLALWLGALYKAYSFGVSNERTRWQLVESKKMAALGEKIMQLNNKKYDIEQQRVKEMADLTANYQQEIKKNENKANAVLANVRAGAIKLRIATVRPASGAGAASQTGASIRIDSKETAAELSQQSAEFLIGQASAADQVVDQLTACQAQLLADRKTNLTGDSHVSNE